MTIEQGYLHPKYDNLFCPVCPEAEYHWFSYLYDCTTYNVRIPSSRIKITSFDGLHVYRSNVIQKGAVPVRLSSLYGVMSLLILDGPWAGSLAADLSNHGQCHKLMSPKTWSINQQIIDTAKQDGCQALLLRPVINQKPDKILSQLGDEFPFLLNKFLQRFKRSDLMENIENSDPQWFTKLLAYMVEENGLKVDRSRFIQNGIPLGQSEKLLGQLEVRFTTAGPGNMAIT